MKLFNRIPRLFAAGGLSLVLMALLSTGRAEDKTTNRVEQPKPDRMITCPVSGDKLGEMGKPYVFTYKGQEIKLCCKDCKKDFDKDPAKYLRKIRAADKKTPAENQHKN